MDKIESKDEISQDSDSVRSQEMTSKSMTRYFLFSINCVSLICGLVLFFVGIVLHSRYSTYLEFLDEAFYDVAAWCIFAGAIVCFVSFLGLYGTVKEDYCSLISYSVALCLLIGLELCLGVAAFGLAKTNLLQNEIQDKMKNSMHNYDQDGHEGVTRVWDLLQTEFDCCGVDFPGDWSMTPWARARYDNDNGDELPSSCCIFDPLKTENFICDISYWRSRPEAGCLKALEGGAKKNALALGAVAVIVGAGQIALVVCSCQLLRAIKRPEKCVPFY